MYKTVISIVILNIICASSIAEDKTWKLPLSEKEQILEANIIRRHNILGLYPSKVEIPPDNAEIDITTTTPFSDVVHAVCWTANYLAGASYRYQFLKKNNAPEDVVETAKERADELFEAVYRCQRVTGVRGLQARGYFLGHGPVYAERQQNIFQDEWHQGHADGYDLRWRGNPSHHNYSDSIHGLGQYYDLCAQGEQKERAREAIDALVSYWVDNDLLIHKLDHSRRPVNILGMTDGKTLNTRIMMAIAGAKVAHHATGKKKFEQIYERLVNQYDVRNLSSFRAEKDFDDAEHVFCHLENLFRIETDPELLKAYGIIADSLWEKHKDDGQSLFTYIYFSIRPDAPGKEKALKEANQSLVTWPSDMTIMPVMNSLFPDRKPPYPVYQAAWDNEYIWKGNLLTSDRWLSRIVTDVDVSPEDPLVMAATDTNGDLYFSLDGASTYDGWHPVENLPGKVKTVEFGPKSRYMLISCNNGFYASVTAGSHWNKLPLPEDSGDPVKIQFDVSGKLALYAVTTKGIYYSQDYGEEFLGKSWLKLTDQLPGNTPFSFHVANGTETRLYARYKDQFFTKIMNEKKWALGKPVGLGEYSKSLNFFSPDPDNPDRIFAGSATLPGRFQVRTIVQESTDSGNSWTNSMEAVFKMFAEGKLMELLERMPEGEIKSMKVDHSDSNLLYAIAGRGVLKSNDGGNNWEVKEEGLDIPLAESLIVPRNGKMIFVGTPGGLYLSEDKGETWKNAHLLLQFDKNRRHELGGAAFIDAYWRARFYGFIDEKLAERSFK